MKTNYLLFLFFIISSCSDSPSLGDFEPNDFDYSYEINSEELNVLNDGGKVTLGISPYTFKSSTSELYKGQVKVEVKEAFSVSEMMISGLSTTSNGRPLETDGMFYVSFKDSLGNELSIDQKKPIAVSVSTNGLDPDMKLYDAEITDGKLNWTNPKAQTTLLEKAGFDNLSFKPANFEKDVLEIDEYTNFSRNQLDSLYKDLYANWVIFEENEEDEFGHELEISRNKHLNWPFDLHPLITSSLKTEKFENTWVNTKAFEARIHSFLLEQPSEFSLTYMDNINSPLYMCDSLAMELCGEDYELREVIRNHVKRRETTIATPTKISESVRDFLNKEVLKNESQIRLAQAELKKKFNKSIRPTEEELNAITLKIKKRNAHRLPQYGFELTTAGWKNIDKGIIPKDWSNASPRIIVSNTEGLIVTRSYLIFPSEKSLVEFDVKNGNQFNFTNPISVNYNNSFLAASIGFGENDQLYFGSKQVYFSDLLETIEISLSKANKEKINHLTTAYSNWNDENNISKELVITDLERRIFEAQVEKRKADLAKTPLFMSAFSPILDYELGKTLFENNCSTCHSLDGSVLAGPGLNQIVDKWPLQEIVLFTKNPKLTCELGFENAITSTEKWAPIFGWMQASSMTESEILNVLLYIDEYAVYNACNK